VGTYFRSLCFIYNKWGRQDRSPKENEDNLIILYFSVLIIGIDGSWYCA